MIWGLLFGVLSVVLWRLGRIFLARSRERVEILQDAADDEADRLLYAADPEFAIEMGYEVPKPLGPIEAYAARAQQNMAASLKAFPGLSSYSGGLLGGLGGMLSGQYASQQQRIAMESLQRQHINEAQRAMVKAQQRRILDLPDLPPNSKKGN